VVVRAPSWWEALFFVLVPIEGPCLVKALSSLVEARLPLESSTSPIPSKLVAVFARVWSLLVVEVVVVVEWRFLEAASLPEVILFLSEFSLSLSALSHIKFPVLQLGRIRASLSSVLEISIPAIPQTKTMS